ncbi:MAG: hypothetical protein ACKVPY_02275 [Paracoccaceae bacterium]
MRAVAVASGLLLAGVLAGCEGGGKDKTRDYGLDAKPLSQLKAGIWIDPDGCDHWIIDDGLEGYLSARLDDKGRPVCSGKPGQGGFATGPYRSGSPFANSF